MRSQASFPTAEAAGLQAPGGADIWASFGTHRVRGHLWKAKGKSRGRVMFCPGFTEFIEKHSYAAHQLHDAGYDLLIIDWPGQGLSGHLGSDPLTVHIDDFTTYLDAAEALISSVGWAEKQVTLIGHSMGGHLALRLADRLQGRIVALILLSPMIAPPIPPLWLGRLLGQIACVLGRGPVYAFGQKPRLLERARLFQADNVLTRDRGRYTESFLWFDDRPDLRRSGASWAWVTAAYDSCIKTTTSHHWMRSIDLPVMALTSGAEVVVHKQSTDRMLKLLPQCERHEFQNARHELCQESEDVRLDLWRRITQFLAGC
ncbi:MAG: hypothetical protein CMM73_01655 [Rhodospirillaceae bacterium]|nr:hypothetical protein [Rhodospirillaceae bacterium]